MKKLNTDSIYIRLSVPISEEEEDLLSWEIIRGGCKEPIAVWNNVILDGHKRYQICQMEQIEFKTRELHFSSEDEAIAWVCSQRVNTLEPLTPQYRYLVGKWVIADLNRKRSRTYGIEKVAAEIGAQLGIHNATGKRYRQYAQAMDEVFEKEPEVFRAVMSGEISVSQDRIIELAQADEKKQKELTKSLLKSRPQKRIVRQKKFPEEPSAPLSIGIKEMPAYDPDMELKGLMLTIPSWISVMERALKRTKMEFVTDSTKCRLKQTLLKMEGRILMTLEELR